MAELLPAWGLTSTLLPYALVAFPMVAITVYVLLRLLPRDGAAVHLTTMTLGVAVLGGGSLLLMTLLNVFVSTDGTTAWTWVLLAFNFMMMFPAGLWFVSLVVFRDRTVVGRSWVWPWVLALITVGSELMMGLLFALGDGTPTDPLLGLLAAGLVSPWFYGSMAAVMGALWAWLPLQSAVRDTLLALTLAAVVAPWIPAEPLVGAVLMGALMSFVFFRLYGGLLGPRRAASEELRTWAGLAGAFLLMTVTSLWVAADPASVLPLLTFGGTMALLMGVEVALVVHDALSGAVGRRLARPVPAGSGASSAGALESALNPGPR